jgi:DNA-3-methyladenine glycosylase II
MTTSGMPVDARPAGLRWHHECPASVPYRLDLTVSVLRRLSTNVVDVLTPGGQYVRALAGSREPVIARVTQVRPEALPVTLEGHDSALVLEL